ncbi:MAG: DUF1150 domain-containing protein [Rhizobiaceae bacterium]|nr:DUF1150 domain-containing protein [Rhizobiaceae bacterium]
MKNNPKSSYFNPLAATKNMSAGDLAKLGVSKIAYIRPMTSSEVMKKFPMVTGLPPQMKLWALFSANGDPIALSDEHSGVLSNAHELELQPVSLH